MSDSGTTDSLPVICNHQGDVYEDGDEFDSPNGCQRFRCEGGVLDLVQDDLFTVQGDLDLPSQAAVDEQSCLSVVEGSVTISGSAADLSPLAQLSRVAGTLDITASDAVSLSGLETLQEIGGNIVIADNAALTQLSFGVWMSVFGDVTIQNNDALASLSGAEFIGQCAACAPADPGPSGDGGEAPGGDGGAEPGDGSAGQPAGEDGLDEPGGGTFYGNILIADNDVLTDIGAMSNLWYAWADVRFRNNASLTGLAGIPLVEIQGDLEVSDHPAMNTTDVEAFATGIDIWGTTTICGNAGDEACP